MLSSSTIIHYGPGYTTSITKMLRSIEAFDGVAQVFRSAPMLRGEIHNVCLMVSVKVYGPQDAHKRTNPF